MNLRKRLFFQPPPFLSSVLPFPLFSSSLSSSLPPFPSSLPPFPSSLTSSFPILPFPLFSSSLSSPPFLFSPPLFLLSPPLLHPLFPSSPFLFSPPLLH